MNMEELNVIKARSASARPGPWETQRNNFIKPELILDDSRIVWCEKGDVAYVAPRGIDNGNADAAFIAGARQDVPRLVAEVERLWAMLREHGIDPEA